MPRSSLRTGYAALHALLAVPLLILNGCGDYSAKSAQAWKVVRRFYAAVSTCNPIELPQYVADGAFRKQPVAALQERVRSICSQRGTVQEFGVIGQAQGEHDSPTTDGRVYCSSYRMKVRYAALGETFESIRICSDAGEPGAPYRVEFYDTAW